MTSYEMRSLRLAAPQQARQVSPRSVTLRNLMTLAARVLQLRRHALLM
jgi:hypothetical protein